MTPTILTAALLAALIAPPAWAQGAPKSPLGPDGAPVWTRILKLSDGRTFVSDGAITVDASLVKGTLPKGLTETPGAVIDRYLGAPHEHEIAYSQFAGGKRPRTYVSPDGVTLSADYVDFLARTIGKGEVRFRLKGKAQPVIVLADGKAVGLLMPMAG